jgi:hypothetical protein
MSDQIIIQHEGKDVDGFETMTVKADMTQQDYASTGQALFEMMQKRAHFSGEKKEASEKVKQAQGIIDSMVYDLSTGKIEKQLPAKWIFNYSTKTKIQSVKMPDGSILMTNEQAMTDDEMQPELFQ